MPRTALVVVDMIQTYDFGEDAERLARNVAPILDPLSGLIARAADEAAMTVYVNDSFGRWQSHRDRLVASALEGEHADLVEPVRPGDDALFVVKARHSIFYGTPLDHILDEEGIDELVLTGQVTEQCIFYSALDAHVRRRSTIVPRDCVAHIHDDLAEAALKMMDINLNTTVCESADVPLR